MCRETGVEIRQVIGIDLSRFVTGYRAETLADGLGSREVVWSRAGVYRPVQYGFDVSTPWMWRRLSAGFAVTCQLVASKG